MEANTTTQARAMPWNKGKLLGLRPPLKLKEVWAIRIRLQLGHRVRDLALFDLAIDSKSSEKDAEARSVRDHRANAGRDCRLD